MKQLNAIHIIRLRQIKSLNDRKKPHRLHLGWSKSGYTGCTLSEVQALDAAWKAKPYGKKGFPSLQTKRDHRPLFGIHLIKARTTCYRR